MLNVHVSQNCGRTTGTSAYDDHDSERTLLYDDLVAMESNCNQAGAAAAPWSLMSDLWWFNRDNSQGGQWRPAAAPEAALLPAAAAAAAASPAAAPAAAAPPAAAAAAAAAASDPG